MKVQIYHAKMQIIYMNFGIDAFPLIRDYLVSELGFSLEEVGIISGKGNYIGKKLFENKPIYYMITGTCYINDKNIRYAQELINNEFVEEFRDLSELLLDQEMLKDLANKTEEIPTPISHKEILGA